MRRGDLASVAVPGDFGKPRPALVIQSDYFEGTGDKAISAKRNRLGPPFGHLDEEAMLSVNRSLAVFPGLA